MWEHFMDSHTMDDRRQINEQSLALYPQAEDTGYRLLYNLHVHSLQTVRLSVVLPPVFTCFLYLRI